MSKKKPKVIQILCHTLDNDKNLMYHVRGNWATRAARSILKYSKAFECEVWYPIRNLQTKKTIKEEGITFKLYPAKTLNILLESFFGVIYAPGIMQDLKKEDPQDTIINFQGERGLLIHSILWKFPQFIYTIQYHGYGQPERFNWIENIFLVPIEKVTFPRMTHFFVHIKRRFPYLTEKIGIESKKLSFQNYGVDYDRFKPGNKKSARKKLEIPQDAFVMIYVGLMTKTKGVDKILNAYKELKPRYPNIYLVFIGAQETDPLIKEARAVADRVIGVTKNEELPLYYQASDVYLFYGNKKTIEYAGTGTAPVEALVSNINVISSNLIHYPGKILKKVGFIPKNFEDFVKKIEYLIRHPKFQFNARTIVYPYSSDEQKNKNIIRIYTELLKKRNK